jgi:NADPH-dependent ferric siderophore reductase
MSYRLFRVRVAATTRLSASFHRVTLHAPELAELAWAGVDQRVKLIVPTADQFDSFAADDSTTGGDGWYAWWCGQPEDSRPPMRTYTISGHRREAGEVDIDFAVHGEAGPLSRFALHARAGDRLLLVAPGPSRGPADGLAWRPGGARHVLCVGDETALPAIRNILAVLEPHQTCRVVIEVPDDSDRLPLPSPAEVQVDWVVRPAGAGVGSAADRVLFGQPSSPASPDEVDPDLWQEAVDQDLARYAWVAGEVGWVNRVRRRLAPAGFGRGNAAFMGYWREGHAARG